MTNDSRPPKVLTFFYGSYMNPAVLAEVDIHPETFEVAKLSGWDIRIEPLANLVPSDRHEVYGVVASLTHAELEHLYAHAREVLGGTYLPHPVIVDARDSGTVAALCYISPGLESKTASADYVDRIVGPAKEHGFPAWYIERLESFRPV